MKISKFISDSPHQ